MCILYIEWLNTVQNTQEKKFSGLNFFQSQNVITSAMQHKHRPREDADWSLSWCWPYGHDGDCMDSWHKENHGRWWVWCLVFGEASLTSQRKSENIKLMLQNSRGSAAAVPTVEWIRKTSEVVRKITIHSFFSLGRRHIDPLNQSICVRTCSAGGARCPPRLRRLPGELASSAKLRYMRRDQSRCVFK